MQYDPSMPMIVEKLAEAHIRIWRQHCLEPVPHSDPAVVAKACAGLEKRIQPLVDALPQSDIDALAPCLVMTRSPALCARVTVPVKRYLDAQDIRALIQSSVEDFSFLVDFGALPPAFDDFDEIHTLLLPLCDGENGPRWLDPVLQFLKRSPSTLVSTVSFADNHTGFLSDNQINAIVRLMKAVQSSDPDQSTEALRQAVVGSATFAAGALILLGATLPVFGSHEPIQGGPKVNALIDTCRSAHGRLAFAKKYGPLRRYFATGIVPDYRQVA